MREAILELNDVRKYFPVKQGGPLGRQAWLRAVDGVSLAVPCGASFGLVGESGCGKSTLSRCIMRLEHVTDGSIRIQGNDIHKAQGRELKALRREVQMVFQNPFESLNPRMRVRALIAEPMTIHGFGDTASRERRVAELLERVGLNASAGARFPHEFSGGQRQRIGIARALALNPKLVICDEPVSALDVSIQAQILNLLKELQQDLNLTYLFISHNLSVVRYMSHFIAVMYMGRIMEVAEAEELYNHPAHPYTQALLSSIPELGGDRKKRIVLSGDPPSPISVTPGCLFASRCPYAEAVCRRERPELGALSPAHRAACHFCGSPAERRPES
ncbi:ABC transporter ATP-binding protein [Bacillota bacterium Meth-B3]